MAYQNMTLYQKFTNLKIKLIVVGLAALVSSVNIAALGLGSLEVHSNLDQPLDGVIELRVSSGDDLSSLEASIASRDDFESLGIAYPSYMKDISLTLETLDGNNVLRVISNNVVIKEPFIHFLVRIDWYGGSFLREYTALIDPPIYAAETPKSLSQPRSVGTDQSYQTEDYLELEVEQIDSTDNSSYQTEALDEIFNDVATDDVEPETTYKADDEPVAEVQTYQETYEEDSFVAEDSSSYDDNFSNTLPTDAQYGPVVSGESLSVIAAELQRQFPDLSIYQIMQVLFEENRGAFIDENINGLLAGAVLNIGDLDAIRAVDVAQAKQFFYDQLTEWDPSSLLPASSSDDGLSVAQNQYSGDSEEDLFDYDSSAADINDLGTDSFQVGASTDSQSLISGSDGDSQAGEILVLQQEIADLESSLSSSSLENIELSTRISLLEGQLADMNSLLSLDVEDAGLASIEANLAEQNNADDLLDEDLLLEDSLINNDEFTELPDSNINDLDIGLETDDQADILFDDDLISLDDETGLEIDDSPIESVLDNIDTGSGESLSIANNTTDEPVRASAINSKLKKDDGFFSNIFNDSMWFILGGVGGLLLLGLGVLIIRRRRADEEFEISMLSIETQSESVNENTEVATMTEMSDGSPDRETSFLTVYSDSDAVVQADEVDPIAEADVYIAYGRDEQAEEVLLDGIVRKPERIDIKQKLLGLYHKNSNVEGFERLAEELYSQKDHLTSSVWQQISLMGKDIAPDNPLFELSASEILADEVLHSDKAVADDETVVAAAAAADSDASEFLTIAEFEDDESTEVKETEKQDDPVQLVTDEEDPSIHLINFDDGRSEMSELDEVGIEALVVDDDQGVSEDVVDDKPPAQVELGDTLDFERIDVPDESDGQAISNADTEVSDLEVDADYDETRTQYELAKVFVDLGDDDGARKILEDIVSNDSIGKDVVADAVKLLESINS